ncbi:hypothetical protein ABH927_003947 [Planotetraspora sp. GP83]
MRTSNLSMGDSTGETAVVGNRGDGRVQLSRQFRRRTGAAVAVVSVSRGVWQ